MRFKLHVKRMTALMNQKGFTQVSLGKACGVSDTMMCFILKGLRNPTVDVLCSFADNLGCTMDDLRLKE